MTLPKVWPAFRAFKSRGHKMPPQGFASKLPEDLRQELDRMIAFGGLSVDDVWAWLRERGSEASRSAVHRHMQNVQEAASEIRKSREMASVFAQNLGPDIAEGNLGQALTEIVQSIVFRQMLPKLSNPDAELDSFKDLAFLGKMTKDLAHADALNADRILKVRKEAMARAAEEVKKVGDEIGAPKDMIKKFEKAILGVNL